MDMHHILSGRIVRTASTLTVIMVLAACSGSRPGTPSPVAGTDGPSGKASPPSPPAYKGPVAFAIVAEGLSASFTDRSTGEIDHRQWAFGDGATSTAEAPVHAYPAAGLYKVTETVVDTQGRSASRTIPVQVMPLPPELHNGVSRGGLSAVGTYDLHFYARPPEGAGKLSFEVTGASPDMDLYVKRGSVPTVDDYDCLATWSGRTATCVIDSNASGPYYARLLAKKNFADASLKAFWGDMPSAVATAKVDPKATVANAASPR